MAETSFPIVGQDLTDSAWSQVVGAVGNGVVNDWGSPYAITVNTNDTITIKPSTRTGFARAVVAGFGHQLDAAKTLSIPAVSAKTYFWVGLLYDPANTTNPVTLTVIRGTVALTGNQEFLPLYIFVRYSGQTLAAATRFDPLPQVRVTLFMASISDLLQLDPLMFPYATEVVLPGGVSYTARGSATNAQWLPGRRTSSGVFYGVVEAAGTTRINHGLGLVPSAVQITPMNHPSNDANSRLFRPVLWGDPDATVFGVRAVDERSNDWASRQQLRFAWTAIYDGD